MKRAITFSFGLVLIWFCSLFVASPTFGSPQNLHQLKNTEQIRSISAVLIAEEDVDALFKLKNSFKATEYGSQLAPILLISRVTQAFKVIQHKGSLHLFSTYHQFF